MRTLTHQLQALVTAAVGALPLSESRYLEQGLCGQEGGDQGAKGGGWATLLGAEQPPGQVNRHRLGGWGTPRLHGALRAAGLSAQGPVGFSSRKLRLGGPVSSALHGFLF